MQKQCIGWNICDFGTWYFSTFSHFFLVQGRNGEKDIETIKIFICIYIINFIYIIIYIKYYISTLHF